MAVELNPLIKAILQQAIAGDLSGAGGGDGGGDPSLGPPGPGGDPSLQTGSGGNYIDSRMQHGIKGVPGPGGDAIWGFGGTVDPFGEVKFG